MTFSQLKSALHKNVNRLHKDHFTHVHNTGGIITETHEHMHMVIHNLYMILDNNKKVKPSKNRFIDFEQDSHYI